MKHTDRWASVLAILGFAVMCALIVGWLFGPGWLRWTLTIPVSAICLFLAGIGLINHFRKPQNPQAQKDLIVTAFFLFISVLAPYTTFEHGGEAVPVWLERMAWIASGILALVIGAVWLQNYIKRTAREALREAAEEDSPPDDPRGSQRP